MCSTCNNNNNIPLPPLQVMPFPGNDCAPSTECEEKLDAKCVIYKLGSTDITKKLLALNVNPNTNLDIILNKINSRFLALDLINVLPEYVLYSGIASQVSLFTLLNSLQQEIINLDSEHNTSILDRLSVLETNVEVLQTNYTSVLNDLEELGNSISDINQDITNQGNLISANSSNILLLQGDLASAESDIQELQVDFQNLNTAVQNNINEIKVLNNKYAPLFIFAGESNAAGVLPRDFLTNNEKLEKSELQFWNENSNEFENSIVGVNTVAYNTANSFGMENQLIHLIENGDFSYDKFFACKIAFSGSIIENLILQINTHLNTLSNCYSSIKSQGYIPIPIVIYSQGINNGGNNLDPEIWKDYTFDYIGKLRNFLGYAPIFITKLISVRIMYNSVIDTFPNFDKNINIIETSDLTLYEPNHWDKSGLAEIINRVKNILLDKYGEKEQHIRNIEILVESSYIRNFQYNKIGVNKINPSEILDVNGNILADGSVKALGGLITTQSVQSDGNDSYFGGVVVKNDRNVSRGLGTYLSRKYIGFDVRSDGTNYTSETDGISNEGILLKTLKNSLALYYFPVSGNGQSFQNILNSNLDQFKTLEFTRTAASIYNTLNLYNRLILLHSSGYQGINFQYNYSPTLDSDSNPQRGDFWVDSNYIYYKYNNSTIKRASLLNFNKGLELRNVSNTGVIGEIYNAGLDDLTVGSSNNIELRTSGTAKFTVKNNGNIIIQNGGVVTDSGKKVQVSGNIELKVPGNKLIIATGANASCGIVNLINGSIVVPTTAVSVNSGIKLTVQELGQFNGRIRVSVKNPGVSFTIQSSDPTDDCSVFWEITN